MSMREAGDSAGATGFGAVLDESWAERLAEPSPTALATSRIRPSEVKGRECMRLSSATTGNAFKNRKWCNKPSSQRGAARVKINFVSRKQDRWMQNSHIR